MIQRFVAVAVIAVGAALLASALHGITQMDTRLAAAPAQTTVLVEPIGHPCPLLDAHDDA